MLKHWPQGLQIGLPNSMVCLFQPGGQYKAINSAFISNFGQIEKIFSSSALTPSGKLLRLISTFAKIGMLDLGWTWAPTPSVKRA
jgi:hypothetical protein